MWLRAQRRRLDADHVVELLLLRVRLLRVEVCLHSQPRLVIVVTDAENAHARAREVGAEACFAKPFEIDELLRATARLLH